MGFLYSQLFVTPKYPTHDFTGQTLIVTGSNTGLGKEGARHFVRLGASKVILAVRNTKAGEEAKRDIEKSSNWDDSVVEVWSLDLSSSSSIKSFAARASKLERLDAVVENAGVVKTKFEKAEGHEMTIQVNVIGTFLLALLLLPKLKSSAKQFNTKPRLTIVTSEVHGWTDFPERKESNIFESLDIETNKKSFDKRYPLSKLLEVLVVKHIAPMLEGSNVILNMLNPGLCHSELSREMDGIAFTIFKLILARKTEVGARTLVASAAASSESHGHYMSDGKVDESVVSKFVKSQEGKTTGERVWKELKEILEKIEPGVTSNLSN